MAAIGSAAINADTPNNNGGKLLPPYNFYITTPLFKGTPIIVLFTFTSSRIIYDFQFVRGHTWYCFSLQQRISRQNSVHKMFDCFQTSVLWAPIKIVSQTNLCDKCCATRDKSRETINKYDAKLWIINNTQSI